jgi:pilus assembly protein FimV
MLRKLALSLAVSAALGVSQVHALGLGEIKVNSALNEPLDAEIKLTQVRDLSPLQIQPRMAAVDEYSLAGGVSQTRYLRDIQFQVQLTPDGAGSIRLRSSEPIQEPFLNFMVEVNWPSGRLVREYTLLLDPPVFDPTPVQRTVQPAQLPQPASAQPAEPRQRPATVSRTTSASNIRTRMDADTQVYVGVNDTLWEIAARSKPANISEHQMMLALLRKNPAAFPSGNINTLRAGSVLDLPSREEASRLTHREAVAEVARQTQLWREGRLQRQQPQAKAPVDVSRQAGESTESAVDTGTEAAPADATPTTTAEGDAAAQDGQLKIVAPVEEQAAADQSDRETAETVTSEEAGVERDGSEAVSAARESLENEVLIAQEKIDRLERENTDLNDKLNSVLEQLEAQSRLLELQSQQMATLQTELTRDAARAPATESAHKDSAGLLQNPAVLGGIGAGALAVLAGLWLMLRRRGAAEPEKKRELVNVPEDLRDRNESENKDSGAGAAAAAAAAVGAGAVAGAMAADDSDTEQPAPLAPLSGESEEFTRPPMQKLAPDEPQDLDQDLQSLDLDMDLDLNDLDIDDDPELDQLDGTLDELEDEADARIDAAEFDLGAEDELTEEPSVQADVAEETVTESDETPTADTDELEFNVKPTEVEEEPSELDSMLGDSDDSDDLDFLLSGDAEEESTSATLAGDDELLEDALKEENGFSLADDAVMPTDDMGLDDEQLFGELEANEPPVDNGLHETVAAVEGDDYEIDHDLEAMLQGAAGDADDDAAEVEISDSADDDLDSLLASFDPEEDDISAGVAPVRPGEQVEEELTANISHDLEMDLDSEVDELLNSTDDEIALEEQRSDEAVEVLDKMNLLSGTDEIETKLDLARAYMEMDDKDGARDILNEITSEGSEEQRLEAQKLLDSLS